MLLEFTPVDSTVSARSPESDIGSSVFIPSTEYNLRLAEKYMSMRRAPLGRLGWYVLHDVNVFGEWGIVYSPPHGETPLLRPGFGWQPEHLNYCIHHNVVTSILRDGTNETNPYPLIAPTKELEQIDIKEPVFLISFPGALTFGHWITDIIGRLYLCSLHDPHDEMRILAPPYRPWMGRFLSQADPLRSRCVELTSRTCFRCSTLVVPTIMSHMTGGTLPVEMLRPPFTQFKEIIRPPTLATGSDSRALFIIHTRQTSGLGRELANSDEVRAWIESYGGRSIDPLKVTLDELIAAINSTETVIGQDSSALHNLALADAKKLIVIETEPRGNLLHASLQEMNRAKISHILADNVSGEWRVDLEAIQKEMTSS
jgi:hypothetical protein